MRRTILFLVLINMRLFCFIFAAPVLAANDIYQYSLTFSEAANLAVTSSSELKQARVSHFLKEGVWMMGMQAFLPRFGLSVSENDRLQEIGSDSFIKNYGVSLDQLIWDGGKTSMSRKLERIELTLSSSGLDRMASEIGESAITSYRNVLTSRAILEIRKAAFLILEEQRRILKEEVELGFTLAVDLASADINLADAKLDIYSLQLDLIEMERQLADLLGLDSLPILAEKVDVNRSILLPPSSSAKSLAETRNPSLLETRYSIIKKEAELKYASKAWIPSVRLIGNFGLSGQRYPLTRYNWSVGINIDFSGPWFQNRFSAQAGLEPPHDKTAMVQNSFNPSSDLTAGYGKKQAVIALAFEQIKYGAILEQLGRMASNAVEKCSLVEQKRILALSAAKLAAERRRVDEIRLNLGQITRLNLMETIIEQTQREVTVIETASALLEAERELERLLDLKPGELASFAASFGQKPFNIGGNL